MKASDKPEISKKWWLKQKPADINGADLEKALAACEKALDQSKKKNEEDSCKAALGSLEALGDAVEKTIKKQCDKKRHEDLITVLEKYNDLIEDERKDLQKIQAALAKDGEEHDDEDEDVNENKLFDKDRLYKMVKLLKNGGNQLKFGFGLNTSSPESSRLVLHRKGKPERLFKALKKTGEFNNRTITYGIAYADPRDASTLVLKLEGGAKEPPRMNELCRDFLRSDHGLKFRKVSIVTADGAPSETARSDKTKNIV